MNLEGGVEYLLSNRPTSPLSPLTSQATSSERFCFPSQIHNQCTCIDGEIESLKYDRSRIDQFSLLFASIDLFLVCLAFDLAKKSRKDVFFLLPILDSSCAGFLSSLFALHLEAFNSHSLLQDPYPPPTSLHPELIPPSFNLS